MKKEIQSNVTKKRIQKMSRMTGMAVSIFVFFILIGIFISSVFVSGKTPLCPAEMKGSGTAEDPCQITNWEQLGAVNQQLSLYYLLMNDLDGANRTPPTATPPSYNSPLFIFSLLNKIKFGKGIELVSAHTCDPVGLVPIGDIGSPFTGVWDGGGNTISNTFINCPGDNYVGFFGVVDKGSVRNINFVNFDVYGIDDVGGFVGWNNQGNARDVSFNGDINGRKNVGGIIGHNSKNGNVLELHFTGGEANGDENVGGIIGLNENGGDVSRVDSSNVNVNGNFSVGGLIGYNDANSKIRTSNSNGLIKGYAIAGGLIGTNYGELSKSKFQGTVSSSGGNTQGGLVGVNYGGNILDSSSSASVIARDNEWVGGLVGENLMGGIISDSYFTGDVIGFTFVGGITGYNGVNGEILNSYSTGSVKGDYSVGGLAGENSFVGKIYDSYSTGAVTASGIYSGGLVGINYGDVSNSYATGNVNGRDTVGGLVGINYGDVSNSYATGSVYSGMPSLVIFSGGLVGANYANILNSYSTGSVTGRNFLGGLVGGNGMSATCTASFWDTQSSGQSASACGEGKTTSEMKTKTTFTGAGWDFINIWDIDDINQIINNGYPFLR